MGSRIGVAWTLLVLLGRASDAAVRDVDCTGTAADAGLINNATKASALGYCAVSLSTRKLSRLALL